MSQVMKHCAKRGCRTLVKLKVRRCPPCEAEASSTDNARRHSKQRAHGRDTAAWDLLRLARLELDGWLCQFRLQGCKGRATTVHLDERLQGRHDLATIDDCSSSCDRCHGRVDAPRAKGGGSVEKFSLYRPAPGIARDVAILASNQPRQLEGL